MTQDCQVNLKLERQVLLVFGELVYNIVEPCFPVGTEDKYCYIADMSITLLQFSLESNGSHKVHGSCDTCGTVVAVGDGVGDLPHAVFQKMVGRIAIGRERL